jgi:hypothetical protein
MKELQKRAFILELGVVMNIYYLVYMVVDDGGDLHVSVIVELSTL